MPLSSAPLLSPDTRLSIVIGGSFAFALVSVLAVLFLGGR